jgi:hypothetical protein
MATPQPVNLPRATTPTRPAPRPATVYLGRPERTVSMPQVQPVHMPQPAQDTKPSTKAKAVKLGSR